MQRQEYDTTYYTSDERYETRQHLDNDPPVLYQEPISTFASKNAPGTSRNPAATEKLRLELVKLLKVAIQRLKNRPYPPSAFEPTALVTGSHPTPDLHATANAVRGAVRLANAGAEWKQDTDHDDDEDEVALNQKYSTEETFNHLTSVRDSLILSGDKLFGSTQSESHLQTNPLVTRSPSPNRKGRVHSSYEDEESVTPASLLDELIVTLGDVVREDCRYQVTRYRPKCPPNALQGVVLEVASVIARLHRNNPEVLSKLGFAILPAFSTFSPRMHERIMRFFEEDLMNHMLYMYEISRRSQGSEEAEPLAQQSRSGQVPEIQVERVLEDSLADRDLPFQPWSSNRSKVSGIAWSAPRQALQSYNLAALVSPLFAALFEAIRLNSRDLTTLHRFHSILRTIIRLKKDAYADIVDVIAFAPSSSRLIAVEALATFWPKAFGHTIFSRPLSVLSYESQISTFVPVVQPTTGLSELHEFLLWRFKAPITSNRQAARPQAGHAAICIVCNKSIVGLGLMCPCCNTTVHARSCYDHNGGVDKLKYISKEDKSQKYAIIRYSQCSPKRLDVPLEEFCQDRHQFRPVHLLSLVLCFICRRPLWGCYSQGLRCSSCLHFAHGRCIQNARNFPSCRTIPFSQKHVTIAHDALKRSWVEHYDSLMWSEMELFDRSYEDVSTAYGIFWMELELLNAGIAAGTIVIEHPTAYAPSNRGKVDEFELHYYVALYGAQLSGSRLARSNSTLEYIENCGQLDSDISLLHDVPLLLMAASSVKLPQSQGSGDNRLLRVDTAEENPPSELEHPFEFVSLAHIRDALGYDINIHSDTTARFLLSHMTRLGLIYRLDSTPLDIFTRDDLHPSEIYSFPSTLAIDASTSVEALFASIQACLEDLDVSINEFGLSLLTRRCWPTGMMTDYALARLTNMVLSWVLSEENRLLLVIRDFGSLREQLPGVRSEGQRLPWPEPIPSKSGSSGSGAIEYTSTRRALLLRYAMPWLLQVHDLQRQLYAQCLYQQCLQLADSSTSGISQLPEHDHSDGELCSQEIKVADETLKLIVKLCQTGIVWTTFDDLFVNWLDTMSRLSRFATPVVFKYLPRLFSSEDLSYRRSIADDGMDEDVARYMMDPWRVIVDAASDDTAGLERCLQWVLVLARSGVEIPNNTLMQLAAFARDFHAPFLTHSILMEALLYSVWVKSMGRSDLLDMIYAVFSRQSTNLRNGIVLKQHMEIMHNFLRHSLTSCLLLYGCRRDTIRSLKLLDESQMISLPPRRRSNITTNPISTNPLAIDMDMLELLCFAAMEGTPETCLIVAKFLNALISEPNLLAANEVDQFVLINGHTLFKCVWHFYSQTQIPDLSNLRITFILRLLVVDPQPFINLLDDLLKDTSPWEQRFETITRLFRMIIDVNTPGLDIPGRQWRLSLVPVIICFFSRMWKDDRIEVRLACDTLMKTLLPSHMDTISLCFEEYLAQGTMKERMDIVSFLTRLHPLLPSWRLISWSALVQCLEDEGEVHPKQNTLETPQTDKGIEDQEAVTFRAAMISLALQMVSDGIIADLQSLLRVKFALVKLIGFDRCTMVRTRAISRVDFEGLVGLVYDPVVQSCFHGMMRVLDTSHSCELPPACMTDKGDETTVQTTLGAIFVDVLVKTALQIDFLKAPYMVARSLMTSLVIVLTKHDFTSPFLSSWTSFLFRAVYSVMQLLVKPDLSFDIKQMIFSVGQAAIKQLQGDKRAASIFREYISVTTAVIVEHGVTSDHMLAVRGRQFFDDMLTQFSAQRIYWVLFKSPCSPEFFSVLGQVLRERSRMYPDSNVNQSGDNVRDGVVREILSMVLERRTAEETNLPMKNLAVYVETLHHTGYSESIISYIGFVVATLSTFLSEWRPTSFDANSLLRVCNLVAQHHKIQSKELLAQVERYLRVAATRFDIERDVILQLLQISITSYRRLSKIPGNQTMANHIPGAFVDIVDNVFRNRIKSPPATFAAFLEIISSSMAMKENVFTSEGIITSSLEGLSYISDRLPDGVYTDADFNANLAVAKVIMQAINNDHRMLAVMSDKESTLPLRVWNFLLLSVLITEWDECALHLWNSLGRFSGAYTAATQRLIMPPHNITTDTASIEIHNAVIALKLWLLLIQQICNKQALSSVLGHSRDRDGCEKAVWNELWPPMEQIIVFSIRVAELEEFQAPIIIIWQSVIDILQLLRHLRSSLALQPSFITILDQIKSLKRGDVISNKVSRAYDLLTTDIGPLFHLEQLESVQRDFLGVEKIGCEVRRRAEERGGVDRDGRRQIRQPTVG